MLLKLLSHFLSGLLVASLCGLIISSVMSQTIMNSSYLEGQLSTANAYNRLSTALSDDLSKQAGLASNPQATALVSSILTPTMLKQKINGALDQLALYYQGKGPAPTIDLTGLAAQAQAAGVPLPANNDLSQPIKLAPDSGTSKTIAYPGKSLAAARTTTIITTILLAVALLAVSWARQRFGALPNALILVSVLIGIAALALNAAPGLLDHYVKFNTASNAFASLGRDLATDIVHDLARRFGIIAGIFLTVGIVTRIGAAKLRSKLKQLPPVKPVPRNAIS